MIETDWVDTGEWTWHVLSEDVFNKSMEEGQEPLLLHQLWKESIPVLLKLDAETSEDGDAQDWCEANNYEVVDEVEMSCDTSEFEED